MVLSVSSETDTSTPPPPSSSPSRSPPPEGEFALDISDEGELASPSDTGVKYRNGKIRGDSFMSAYTRRLSHEKNYSFIGVFRTYVEYAQNRWQQEKLILRMHWKILLTGIIFQYIHSVCTNVVYYLHVPRQPLYDLGFVIFPALSREMQILSEIMFFMLFGGTILFMLSPFFMRHRCHLFTGLMVTRFLGVCFFAQLLRCITFLITVLPGPNYHCRPLSPDYNPPKDAYDIFFRQDAFFGCGDLLFSSHTIFVLLCALTYTKYADPSLLKKFIWVLVFFFGCLVVSARKHYSIDIVVAWYTVPLLWVAFDKYYPDRIPPELLDDKDTIVISKKLKDTAQP